MQGRHVSREHSYFSPRDVRAFENYNPTRFQDVEDLRAIGITMDEHVVEQMAASTTLKEIARYAMDAIQPTITTASIQVPIQFLQTWLPGFVFVLTAPREI